MIETCTPYRHKMERKRQKKDADSLKDRQTKDEKTKTDKRYRERQKIHQRHRDVQKRETQRQTDNR